MRSARGLAHLKRSCQACRPTREHQQNQLTVYILGWRGGPHFVLLLFVLKGLQDTNAVRVRNAKV
jgi:hypothetical protein